MSGIPSPSSHLKRRITAFENESLDLSECSQENRRSSQR
jgi:hypothetical protein